MSERNPNYGYDVGGGPYLVPGYARAMLSCALRPLKDINGDSWDASCLGPYDVPGLTLRPYCWDGGPDELARPNLEFGELRLWFYKYFGRRMSSNVDWSPAEWVACYEALVEAIEGSEDE